MTNFEYYTIKTNIRLINIDYFSTSIFSCQFNFYLSNLLNFIKRIHLHSNL